MASLQEFPVHRAPREAPPIDYAIKSYLPFVAATSFIPLIGLLTLLALALRSAVRGQPLRRPGSLLYTLYLILGAGSLLGGAPALYKAGRDYTFGVMNIWRYIRTVDDLLTYEALARLLAAGYLAVGLIIGLSLLLILYRRTYDAWYADLAVYLGNAAWFLVLADRPLRDFHYYPEMRRLLNIPPGVEPYDTIAPMFHTALAAGALAGALASLTAYALYKRRRPRTPHTH